MVALGWQSCLAALAGQAACGRRGPHLGRWQL